MIHGAAETRAGRKSDNTQSQSKTLVDLDDDGSVFEVRPFPCERIAFLVKDDEELTPRLVSEFRKTDRKSVV